MKTSSIINNRSTIQQATTTRNKIVSEKKLQSVKYINSVRFGASKEIIANISNKASQNCKMIKKIKLLFGAFFAHMSALFSKKSLEKAPEKQSKEVIQQNNNPVLYNIVQLPDLSKLQIPESQNTSPISQNIIIPEEQNGVQNIFDRQVALTTVVDRAINEAFKHILSIVNVKQMQINLVNTVGKMVSGFEYVDGYVDIKATENGGMIIQDINTAIYTFDKLQNESFLIGRLTTIKNLPLTILLDENCKNPQTIDIKLDISFKDKTATAVIEDPTGVYTVDLDLMNRHPKKICLKRTSPNYCYADIIYDSQNSFITETHSDDDFGSDWVKSTRFDKNGNVTEQLNISKDNL